MPGGYDFYCIADKKPGERTLAANLYDPASGRGMEVYTTEPGIQCYTGNGLDGKLVGRSGVAYAKQSAVCLEPTRYPDAPNHPAFPSAILKPGETYQQNSVFRFYTK